MSLLDIPDDFSVDDLVSSFLQARRVVKLAQMEAIAESGPPTEEKIKTVIKLVIESKFLEELINEIDGGILTFGARALGYDTIPLSDKTREPVEITREQHEKSVDKISEMLSMEKDEIIQALEMLDDRVVVKDDEEEKSKPDENSKEPNLDWSFK